MYIMYIQLFKNIQLILYVLEKHMKTNNHFLCSKLM